MEMRGMSGELLGTIGPVNSFPDSQPTDEKPPTTKSTDPSSTITTSRAKPQPNPSPKPSSSSSPSPSLPPAFLSKKRKILSTLHPPTQDDYTDKSPKGSVDTQIASLIDEINAYPGLVTTSSCAGRVSVFLEGVKTSTTTSGTNERSGDWGGDGDDDAEQQQDRTSDTRAKSNPVPVPGGKGLGGRWLFVSHEPLGEPSLYLEGRTWSEVFNISPYEYGSKIRGPSKKSDPLFPRLIKFAFEPLILHVLCADLRHAAPLLAAAMNAGFRESGVQSLKGTDASEKGRGGDGVMVGIRTAGLGVESLIGVLEEDRGNEICRAIVGEDYLELLVKVSKERFCANEERRDRFRKELREHMIRFEEQAKAADEWEDKDARARRKRSEGLQRKEQLRKEQTHEQHESIYDAQGGYGEDYDLEHK